MATRSRSNTGAGTNGSVSERALLELLTNSLSGGTQMTEGEGVDFYKGTKILVPEGTTYEGARKVIDRAEREAETETRWDREFRYRFNDGAYALLKVLKRRYGGAFGETVYTMFGPQPPELKTIKVSVTETAQVPMGKLSIPNLPKLSMHSLEDVDREYGRIYKIVAIGPRKYAKEVDAIFVEVETELRNNSIYRGKAIIGANNPDFIDLSTFKGREIVFAQTANDLMETALWAPLRHADDLRAEGVPLKRAVLLHGPYGTGKTSAGLVTAQLAERFGWTAVFGKSGRDSIEETLRTAKLYQPAVVFLEDIDNETASGDTEDVARLLEALDGATSKGQEIMLVVTTNHLERVHKGMLRPGRFDAVVEIAALDPPGITRLIKAVVNPAKLSPAVDFVKVNAEMKGFYPAFVREAVDRARVVAITQHGRDYMLDTTALVAAAQTLNAQLRAMEAADEGTPKPALEVAFTDAVRGAVKGLVATDPGELTLVVAEPSDDNDQ